MTDEEKLSIMKMAAWLAILAMNFIMVLILFDIKNNTDLIGYRDVTREVMEPLTSEVDNQIETESDTDTRRDSQKYETIDTIDNSGKFVSYRLTEYREYGGIVIPQSNPKAKDANVDHFLATHPCQTKDDLVLYYCPKCYNQLYIRNSAGRDASSCFKCSADNCEWESYEVYIENCSDSEYAKKILIEAYLNGDLNRNYRYVKVGD